MAEENDTQKQCNSCREMIHVKAEVCHYCNRGQGFWCKHFGGISVWISIVAIIVSITMMALAIAQYFEAHKQRIDASKALDTAIAVANDVKKFRNQILTVKSDIMEMQSNIADIRSVQDDIIRTDTEENKPKLNKQYSKAHTVFGIYHDRFVVTKGLMPENLEIDWKTGKVQSTNNNVLVVTLPDMVLNGKTFIGGNVTYLEKRVGAKTKPIIIIGEFNPILEVIGIDGELVTVALGFPVDDPPQ